MSFLLTKLLPLVIYPLGLVIILCLSGVLLGLKGFKRCAILSVLLAVGLLWVSSTAVCADFILGSLENKYPPVVVEDLPVADAIVILGGMTRGVVPGTGSSDLGGSVDRLFQGAKLYRTKKAPFVILAGGGVPGHVSEAELMAEVLAVLGVPRNAMLLESRSRNTYQNGVNILPILQAQGLDRVLLVTSASHMKRAIAVFEALGVDVIPAATDYQVVEKVPSCLDWLPDAESLSSTTKGIKEYVGLAVYLVRGWL
jgi:uncharacterized SAM-binding protein YcdF (DUF218 family)